MKAKYNVLVFPGGTEIGLEIHRSLGQCKEITLFSAGANVSNHAPYVFARHFIMPSIHEAGWLAALNRIVTDNSIDYIFPAYDDIIVALAENAEKIKAKIVTSPLPTCHVTRSKSATYRHLGDILPVPTIYDTIDSISQYPVFVKPDKGQGSENTHLARDKDHLVQLLRSNVENIIMEALPGEEYTVDCFSDRDAGIQFVGARERLRARSGISMNCRAAARQDTFADYARIISSRLTFHGAWFFQVKRDAHGVLKLLEIAPRIAGAMSLHRAQGINFPLLSLYEQERVPITVLKNDAYIELDRALVNRYRHRITYSTVYIDLDDTLILNEKVNVQLIGFIYQCRNEGKKIVLITKHDKDLGKTLGKHHLTGISDEIIHIAKADSKSDHIKGADAILIDDSFSERKAASDRLGIPTFDCSMLEVLLDERR